MRAVRRAALAALVFAGTAGVSAQTNREMYNGRLRASPHEVQAFDAGACHVTITYGRPSKKGRAIWGALVPWDKWWMPGADEATILTTTKPVRLDSLTVPAGDHTLYMWPDENKPELIVSNEVGQFHTVYHPAQDLGRVPLSRTGLSDPVEEMTFAIEWNEVAGVGALKLSWDDRAYSVKLSVPKAPRNLSVRADVFRAGR